MSKVQGLQSMVDILEELDETDAYLDAVTVHLFKEAIILSPATVPSDFDEADYTGYAASDEVVWLGAYIDADGNAVLRGETVQFQPTGTTTGNAIYGYWIQKGTGGSAKMVAAESFDDPVFLNGPLDSLFVNPEYKLPQL